MKILSEELLMNSNKRMIHSKEKYEHSHHEKHEP